MPSSVLSMLTAGGALALVLALICVAQRGARWAGVARRPGASTRLLALDETLALDTRRRLVLVRCGERQCLLLTGGTQDVLLGWLP
ncbi:flagellar biosynthetic protein FliO, partial [Acidisphaera rubrifaciens]|uniref:Flagellar biosynthesis protein FliO n=1 Tax=Acidisphaera rubrifaciens HS-AP3 TaxID=1231350 RepID=A0A0D6PA76_9PROT